MRMLPASLCDADNTAERGSAGLLVLTRRWAGRREAGKPAARQGKDAGARWVGPCCAVCRPLQLASIAAAKRGSLRC